MPVLKKELVDYLLKVYSLNIKQACSLLQYNRSSYYYLKKEKTDSLVIEKLTQLAQAHPTYGFWKMYKIIRRLGYLWNHKRVYRIYKLLKMNLNRRARKRLPTRIKTPLEVPEKGNQVWSMDFMSDSLQCRRRFRTLNILDDYNRELLGIEVNTSIPSYLVVEEIKQIISDRGKPKQIRVDNGPEFISHTFIDFCNQNKIEINYIQPVKPMQNGFIERFNRSYRTEILDAYLNLPLRYMNLPSNGSFIIMNIDRMIV